MLEANPRLTPAQVKDILQRTATPLAPYYAHEVGAGMLNAHAAVLEAAFPARRMGQFRAGAQPHPFALAIADAKDVIDRFCFGRREQFSEPAQAAILRMNEHVDVADGEERLIGRHTEHRVHGIRPVDASAREIPIP